jgi:hypothetical protein
LKCFSQKKGEHGEDGEVELEEDAQLQRRRESMNKW